MATVVKNPTSKTWWILHNDDMSTCCHGETDVNQITESALINKEIFHNEEDYIARCKELGVDLFDE